MANEKRLIDANALKEKLQGYHDFFVDGCGGFRYLTPKDKARVDEIDNCIAEIVNAPTVDAVEVVHGRWLYEAHRENSNYRWNVTAECSECCDEKKEIWAGFFPNVPDWLARDVAMQSAKSVKLSNYCPNCGAKMDGERKDNG